MHWDHALFFLINGWAKRWPLVDEWWRFWANDYVVPSFVVGLLAIDWLAGQSQRRLTVVAALIAIALANAFVAFSNLIWFRPRPFTQAEVNLLYYYPSDSAFPANSVAVVSTVAWVLFLAHRKGGSEGRWYFIPALVAALLMGFARVWVGVHYPADILGGIVVGIIAGVVAWQSRTLYLSGVRVLVWLARLLKLD